MQTLNKLGVFGKDMIEGIKFCEYTTFWQNALGQIQHIHSLY